MMTKAVLPSAPESLSLAFTTSMDLVSPVRRFVAEFYGRALPQGDLASRLAMAVHELLENAVRHAADGRAEVRVSVERCEGGVRATVATLNVTRDEDLPRATAALDQVIEATDPAALYLELLRRAAKRADGTSGVGLGRIRAEGELSLSYEISGNAVSVVASGVFT